MATNNQGLDKTVLKLEKEQKTMLAIAALQVELRQVVQDYMDAHPEQTRHSLTKGFRGVTGAYLKRFMDAEGVVLDRMLAKAIASFTKRQDLFDQMTELLKGANYRLIGQLVKYPADVINLFYSVKILRLSYRSEFRNWGTGAVIIARIFAHDEELVHGLFVPSKESLARLRKDEDLRLRLEDILTSDDLNEQVIASAVKVTAELQEMQFKIAALRKRFAIFHSNRRAQAAALGMNDNSLKNSLGECANYASTVYLVSRMEETVLELEAGSAKGGSMTGNKNAKLLEWQKKRSKVLELAPIQVQLREVIAARLAEHDGPVDRLATPHGIKGTYLRRFAAGNGVVVSGKTLKGVLAIVGRSDLESKILDIADGLSAMDHAIVAQPLGVIKVFFDLLEFHWRFADFFNARYHVAIALKTVFGDEAETYYAVVTGRKRKEAVERLGQERVQQAIREKLADEALSDHVHEAHNAFYAEVSDLQAQLRIELERIRPEYPGRPDQADALGITVSVLSSCLSTDAAPKNLRAIIETAKRLNGDEIMLEPVKVERVPVARETPLVEVIPSAAPTQEGEVRELTIEDILLVLNGDVSPLGVRFIGKPGAATLDWDPSMSFVDFVKAQLEITRGLLNMMARLQSDSTKQRIRSELGDEVSELELSIRLFVEKHPNALTDLFAAQRATWAGNGSNKPK